MTGSRQRVNRELRRLLQAQFGMMHVVCSPTAVEAANAWLRQVFAVSQQLDDDKPETPDQRHTMLHE